MDLLFLILAIMAVTVSIIFYLKHRKNCSNQKLDKRTFFRWNRYKPNPIQEAFHYSEKPCRLLFGGVQSGKSTAGIWEIVYAIKELRLNRILIYSPFVVLIKRELHKIYEILHIQHNPQKIMTESTGRRFIGRTEIVFTNSFDKLIGYGNDFDLLYGIEVNNGNIKVINFIADIDNYNINPGKIIITTQFENGSREMVDAINRPISEYVGYPPEAMPDFHWEAFFMPTTCNPTVHTQALMDIMEHGAEPGMRERLYGEFEEKET